MQHSPLSKRKLRRYEGNQLGSGCQQKRGCINYPLGALICCVCTWKLWNGFLLSCTRGFMGATPMVDLWLIVQWHRVFGGRTCREMPRSILRNVTNVKGMHQTSISLKEISIRSLVQAFRLVGARDRRFVIVATDYFTKWVEAEALANIWDVDVKKFVWKSIVSRFEVPKALILINKLQFDSKAFKKYYGDLRIKNKCSSLAFPQSNGQIEATNKAIVNRLNKRLENANGKWAKELPIVLWAY